MWFRVHLAPITKPYSITTFANWLINHVNYWNEHNLDIVTLTALFMQVVWSIWKQRNELVFQSTTPNPMATIITAKSHCFEFLQACQTNTHFPMVLNI